ncbi:MAG: RusA family crossover junction endodeoxyribonuclease [bacterium]|nr:RusA family crossover junction endodeoxyribonuclease [bacterium]
MHIKITPVPKPRMVKSDTYSQRPCVARYWAFADQLRYLAKQNQFELGDILNVTFIVPMPKSWSEKKKLKHESGPHQQTPDIDNLCKAVMDALCKEDKHIHTIYAQKVWGTEGIIIFN